MALFYFYPRKVRIGITRIMSKQSTFLSKATMTFSGECALFFSPPVLKSPKGLASKRAY